MGDNMNEKIVHFVADRIMVLVRIYAIMGRFGKWPKWLKILSCIFFPITFVYFTLYYICGFIGLVLGIGIGMPILMAGPLFTRMKDKIKTWRLK